MYSVSTNKPGCGLACPALRRLSLAGLVRKLTESLFAGGLAPTDCSQVTLASINACLAALGPPPPPPPCARRPQVYKTSQQALEALCEKLGPAAEGILGDLLRGVVQVERGVPGGPEAAPDLTSLLDRARALLPQAAPAQAAPAQAAVPPTAAPAARQPSRAPSAAGLELESVRRSSIFCRVC